MARDGPTKITHSCPVCGKFVDAFEADENGQHPDCTAWWGSPDLRKKVWDWAWFPNRQAAIEQVGNPDGKRT